jgi:hypothetical protein
LFRNFHLFRAERFFENFSEQNLWNISCAQLFTTARKRLVNTTKRVEHKNRFNLSFVIRSKGIQTNVWIASIDLNEESGSEIVFLTFASHFRSWIVNYNICIESQWVYVTFYVLLVFGTLNKVFPVKIQDIHEILAGFLKALAKVHFLSSSYMFL